MAQITRDGSMKLTRSARRMWGTARASMGSGGGLTSSTRVAAPQASGSRPSASQKSVRAKESGLAPKTRKRAASFEEYLDRYPQARGSLPTEQTDNSPKKRVPKKKPEEPTS
jgi:hypothetical protein